jgi:hypothetical protein
VATRYHALRERFASDLDRAAQAQDAGNLPGIETGYEALDEVLPRGESAEYDKLHIALNFWDGWIDARNHDWHYYEGIAEQDWPNLARLIAADLRADREPRDERIRRHFDLRDSNERPSLWNRLRAKIGKP